MVRRAGLLIAVLALGCSSSSGTPAGDGGTTGCAPFCPSTDSGGTDSSSLGDVRVLGDSGADSSQAADSSQGIDAPSGPGNPPFGQSSGGTGGMAGVGGTLQQAGGVSYYLIVPSAYAGSPTPLLVVYSGTEGGAQMTMNLMNLGPQTGTDGFIEAVLDGVTYYGDGMAGATALDDVRAKYNVDNDRTYLLGESAGTSAALALGFHIRQSYFAAYWANDVNASDTPGQNASQLGFAPWGQAGPGGDLPDADAIVMAEQAAGYRLPNPAPYNGPGSTSHGDINQFIAAVSWFPGKTRQ